MAGAVIVAAVAYAVGQRSSASSSDDLVIRQRTYRAQVVFSARYTANGESMHYSAAEAGSVPRIYTVSSSYPEPRATSDSATLLLAIFSKDEMAVLIGAKFQQHHRVFRGTLASMPVGGGMPRELLTSVSDADWSADGSQLAVVHVVDGEHRLEYPIGTVLYETSRYIGAVRVSPDGQRIAFLDHPEDGDDRGFVAVVDLKGTVRRLTPQFSGIEGLAWHPGGDRLWYSASADGGFFGVSQVSLGGAMRTHLPTVGDTYLEDIARDGRMLVTRVNRFSRMMATSAGDTVAWDVSWLNASVVPTISDDGSLLAFSDVTREAGGNYGTMVRRIDGSPAIRIGAGLMGGLSHDNRWLLSSVPTDPVELRLYPVGAGASRRLDQGEFATINKAAFIGDGSQLLVCGNEPSRAVRCYVRARDDGPSSPARLRAVTPDGVTGAVLAPDGTSIVARAADASYRRFSLRDGADVPVAGLTANDVVLRYSPDGRSLWVMRADDLPVRLERVDLQNGARTSLGIPPFARPRPGMTYVPTVALADDPRSHVWVEREAVSDVFELKGLK